MWSLLPLAVFLALSALVTGVLVGIARVAFGAFIGAGAPPERGCGAGCAPAVVVTGAASIFAAVVGAGALPLAIGAAVSAFVVAGLAQWADYMSDISVVRAGQGQALINALEKLCEAGPSPARRWATLLNTQGTG